MIDSITEVSLIQNRPVVTIQRQKHGSVRFSTQTSKFMSFEEICVVFVHVVPSVLVTWNINDRQVGKLKYLMSNMDKTPHYTEAGLHFRHRLFWLTWFIDVISISCVSSERLGSGELPLFVRFTFFHAIVNEVINPGSFEDTSALLIGIVFIQVIL